MCDLHECPACNHCSMMILGNVLMVCADNERACDGTTAKGGDGKLTAESPKVGCYCFLLLCGD